MKKLTLIFCFALFISCNKKDFTTPINTFGNIQKNNNYDQQGNIYTTVPLIEEVSGSDINYFVGTPLSIPGNFLVTTTGQSTVALLRGRAVQWELTLEDQEFPVTSYASQNRKIYFAASDTNLYCVDFKGDLIAKVKLESAGSIIFSDPLILGERVYISNSEGSIYSIDKDLKEIQKYEHKGSFSRQISSNGSSIFLNNSLNEEGDRLLILNKDLNLESEYILEDNGEVYSFPVVNDSLVIIFQRQIMQGEYFYKTIALDHKGKLQWEKETTMAPRQVSCDSDGNIYVTFNRTGMGQTISQILKFNSNGEQLASFNIDHFIATPPIIASDYLAFLGFQKKSVALYFLNKSDLKIFDKLDLSNINLLNYYPAITGSNTLKFTSETSPKIVTLKSTMLDLY